MGDGERFRDNDFTKETLQIRLLGAESHHFLRRILIVSFRVHCGGVWGWGAGGCVDVRVVLDLTVYVYVYRFVCRYVCMYECM